MLTPLVQEALEREQEQEREKERQRELEEEEERQKANSPRAAKSEQGEEQPLPEETNGTGTPSLPGTAA